MINSYKLKMMALRSHFQFFKKWFDLISFSFFFYILLTLLATILESVSIISLIPLIQSLQSLSLETNDLSPLNNYLIHFKNKFNLGIKELFILFFSLQFFKLLISHLAEILLIRKTLNINKKIQIKIIENITNLSWINCMKISTGKVNNLITLDSMRVAAIFKILCLIINYSFFFTIYVFGLFYISFTATIIVAIFAISSFFILRLLASITYKSGKKITKSSKDYLDLITDLFLQMKPLKSSNYLNHIKEKINIEIFNFRNANVLQKFVGVCISFLQNLILIFLFGFVIIFFFQKGAAYFTESIIFIFISYRLSQQITQFQTSINQVIAFIPNAKQLQDYFLDSEKKAENNEIRKFKSNFKSISFKNVECKIEKKLIFKNINLQIKKNSFVVILGRSGIGKSSLIDMIIGLIPPSKGNILVNKKNFNELDINHWRSKISYVPQEHFLLKDNIKNNIILNEKYNERKFKHILKILELNYLDTELILSEKGSSLSVGQKQRVSIARAFYSDRELIILDEPTSNLNSLLEKKILLNLKKKTISKTIIMVTHNQTAIKYASIVFKVTKNGLTEIKK